jgi:hypothetical protein
MPIEADCFLGKDKPVIILFYEMADAHDGIYLGCFVGRHLIG